MTNEILRNTDRFQREERELELKLQGGENLMFEFNYSLCVIQLCVC